MRLRPFWPAAGYLPPRVLLPVFLLQGSALLVLPLVVRLQGSALLVFQPVLQLVLPSGMQTAFWKKEPRTESLAPHPSAVFLILPVYSVLLPLLP